MNIWARKIDQKCQLKQMIKIHYLLSFHFPIWSLFYNDIKIIVKTFLQMPYSNVGALLLDASTLPTAPESCT